MIHALWIEWREQTRQTTALLGLAGMREKVEPDAHREFEDLFSPPPPPGPRRPRTPEERADRHRLIARLAGG